jgi:hypothetical protein
MLFYRASDPGTTLKDKNGYGYATICGVLESDQSMCEDWMLVNCEQCK